MKRKIVYRPEDFSPAKLPKTRGEQYRAYLKNEKLTFLYLSLLLLLFALPLLATLAFRGEYVRGLDLLLERGEMTSAERNASLFQEDFLFDLLFLLSYEIFFLGLSGVMQIFRNLAYDEGVLFWGDFKRGIKKNAGQMAFIAFSFSLLHFALTTFLDLLPLYHSLYFQIGVGLFLALTLLLANPLLLLYASEVAAYENRISDNLHNLFPLLGYGYLQSLLFALAPLACYFLTLLGNSLWLYLAYLLLGLLAPYYLAGWHQTSLALFDKTLNRYYPEYERKGLYGKEK